MEDIVKQIESLVSLVEQIAVEVSQKHKYELVPELMNVMEVMMPVIFSVNGEKGIFDNNDIIVILNDIVDAYENQDAVLMEDVLMNGLNDNLNRIIQVLI